MIFEPIVSVIIPNFNGSGYITDAVTSVIRQTYPHWECLVVDDGSMDSSCQMVSSLAQQDPRVKLLHRHRLPKGGSTCRNIGLRHSRGLYVIFLDADDVLADYCLQQRVDAFHQNLNCDFLVFPQLLFEKQPDDLRRLWDNFESDIPDLYRFLRFYVVWQTMAPIYKRDFLLALGGFDESYSRIQDVELACRMLLRMPNYRKFKAVPDCFYRKDWTKEKKPTFRQMRYDNISRFLKQVAPKIDPQRLDYPKINQSLINLLIFNLDTARKIEGFDKANYAPEVRAFIQNFRLSSIQHARLTLLERFLSLSPLGERGLLRIMHSLFPKFWPAAEQGNWGKTVYAGDLTYAGYGLTFPLMA